MSVHPATGAEADQSRAPRTTGPQRKVDGLVLAPGGDRSTYELTLSGALDLTGAPLLRALLRDAIAGGYRDIRLNLAGVSFLDTVGLTVLLTVRSQLAEVQGRLVLENPSWSVRRLVCLADLCPLLGLATGRNRCRHNDPGTSQAAGGSRYPAAEPIEQDTPLRITGTHITGGNAA